MNKHDLEYLSGKDYKIRTAPILTPSLTVNPNPIPKPITINPITFSAVLPYPVLFGLGIVLRFRDFSLPRAFCFFSLQVGVPGNIRYLERMFPGTFILQSDNIGERTVRVTTSYT